MYKTHSDKQRVRAMCGGRGAVVVCVCVRWRSGCGSGEGKTCTERPERVKV